MPFLKKSWPFTIGLVILFCIGAFTLYRASRQGDPVTVYSIAEPSSRSTDASSKTQVGNGSRALVQEKQAIKQSGKQSDEHSFDSPLNQQGTAEFPAQSAQIEQQKTSVGESNDPRKVLPVVDVSKHTSELRALDRHLEKERAHMVVAGKLNEQLTSSAMALIATLSPEQRKEALDALESQLSNLSANMDEETVSHIRKSVLDSFAAINSETSSQTERTQQQIISDLERLAPRFSKWIEGAKQLSSEEPNLPTLGEH